MVIRRIIKGFTLLELLLVLALFVVLLGMLWNIISLFSKSQMQGTRLAERSQLVRSLAQLLEDDLKAAIQDPIHPLENSIGDDDVRRFGLSGTLQILRVDVIEINPFVTTTVPQPRQALLGEIQTTTPRAAELKTVFYDFQHSHGLVRREIDFETPDFNTQTTEGTYLQAPEVVSCRFRYYDGLKWSDSWESLEHGGLPVAIEVTLHTLPLAEAERYRREATPNENFHSAILRLHLSLPVLSRIVAYLPASPIRKFETYQRKTPPRKEDASTVPLTSQPLTVSPVPQQQPLPSPPPEPTNKSQQSWIRGSQP
ncbi:MAG: type II secretion system protein GspJ [Planctomycetaceae bacterium]|jgi:prepilin-type N-terminal cleavage/methylation domain-containing protein|nr:type II secretion system protein GspJ [Planctomycetaceae bacterium]